MRIVLKFVIIVLSLCEVDVRLVGYLPICQSKEKRREEKDKTREEKNRNRKKSEEKRKKGREKFKKLKSYKRN